MKCALRSLFAVVLVQAALVTPAVAANDYFLQIDSIKGGSTVIGFEGQIQPNFWSWSLTYPEVVVGSGQNQGKPTFSDFSWTQAVDSSITALFTGLASGQAFDEAKLSVVRSASAKPTSFFEMIFSDVSLTGLSVRGTGSEAATASLKYSQLTMRYRTIDDKGKLGDWVTGTFDTRSRSLAASFTGDPNVVLGLFESGGDVQMAVLPAATVPEPSTWAMLLAGLGAVAAFSRRRRVNGIRSLRGRLSTG